MADFSRTSLCWASVLGLVHVYHLFFFLQGKHAGQQCQRLSESELAGWILYFPPCNLALERDLLVGVPSGEGLAGILLGVVLRGVALFQAGAPGMLREGASGCGSHSGIRLTRPVWG